MYLSRPSARRRSPPSSSSTEAVVGASGRDARIAQPSSTYSVRAISPLDICEGGF